MENNNFGLHLTLDLKNCDNVNQLTKTDVIYDFLLIVAKTIGMKHITLPYVVKWLDVGTKIEGITGFVIIAESHISIHTYPERKLVQADVFSCRNFNVNRAIALFTDLFKTNDYEKTIVRRG